MVYESHSFLPFLFEGFLRKNCCLIAVDLLLFGWFYCWLNYLLNLFLSHKKGKIIFRTITFDSFFQHLVYFTSIKYTIWKSITITTFFYITLYVYIFLQFILQSTCSFKVLKLILT